MAASWAWAGARARALAWGRIGWLTGAGAAGLSVAVQRIAATQHASPWLWPLKEQDEPSWPAGRSRRDNDTMRIHTGPAHPRLAVSTLAGRLSHCAVTSASSPSFFSVVGTAREGLWILGIVVLPVLPGTLCPGCDGPSLGPSLGSMGDQIWQRDAVPGVDQAHSRRDGFSSSRALSVLLVSQSQLCRAGWRGA